MQKTDSSKTTIKIQTNPDTARTWTAQAKRLGISRNDYLLSLIDSPDLFLHSVIAAQKFNPGDRSSA